MALSRWFWFGLVLLAAAIDLRGFQDQPRGYSIPTVDLACQNVNGLLFFLNTQQSAVALRQHVVRESALSGYPDVCHNICT